MTEITKSTEAKKDEMQVEKEKLESVKRADAAVKTMHDFTSPEVLYKELINSVLKYHPSTDISMIEKAYKVASEAHEGQKRKSGEPYIIHPLCVAINLCKAGGFVKPHADRLCYIHYGRAALELLYNIILQCNLYHKNYLHYN